MLDKSDHQQEPPTANAPDPRPDPLLYRIQDAMRLLSVSRATIYRMINREVLETVRIGTATRITADSIAEVLCRAETAV